MKQILFNSEMVKAILAGRKTETRRVMLPQPETIEGGMYCDRYNNDYGKFTFWTKDHKMLLFKGNVKNTAHWRPSYLPGDILYVREAYCRLTNGKIRYRADYHENTAGCPKWKPSIHMPKKYARIFLKIIDVRVQRLQDISFMSMMNEGYPTSPLYSTETAKWWINLWNSTAKDGFKWEDNPFVFVYDFVRAV